MKPQFLFLMVQHIRDLHKEMTMKNFILFLTLLCSMTVFGYEDVLKLSKGGTGNSAFATGGMCFSDGTKLLTDATKIFWDNTNKRIGIGTASPGVDLEVNNASGGRIRSGGGINSGFEFNDVNTRIAIPAANSMAFYSSNTERMRIDSSGRMLFSAIHNNGSGCSGSSDEVCSGTYTPSTSGSPANCGALGHVTQSFTRIGDVVSGTIKFTCTVTTANTSTTACITKPITSNFTSVHDVIGNVSAMNFTAGNNVPGMVDANTTSDIICVNWYPTTTGSHTMYGQYRYLVL